jgi:flagellar protein FlaH
MADKEEEILSIQVERDELHEQLGGGFPRGSICYMTGAHSTGKSVIAQRLAFGLLENKYTVTYISTELSTKEFIDQMYSVDYRVANYLLQDKLTYIPVYPLLSSIKKREDFLAKLMRAESLFESRVIVIDTLSALIGASYLGGMTVSSFIHFLKKLSALGKVVILTVDPDEVSRELSEPFKAAATAYWSLSLKSVGGTMARVLQVMRFGSSKNPFEETIGFKVTPGVGIVIEITTVG